MRGYVRLFLEYMRAPALAAAVVVGVSTAGFVGVAGMGWFDALYMTFITVGTVGFSEVGPIGTAGRLWTMLVIVLGYATLVGMTARFTSLLVSGEIKELRTEKRRRTMQAGLEGHMIVVGFGRVGRATAEACLGDGFGCAVVVDDPALAAEIEEAGAVPVVGDARDTDTLVAAGLARAKSLVSTLSDVDNLVVVSTARTERPDLRIVARVADVDWCARLTRAGADDLVPIYRTAGQHLALSATTAGVVGVMPTRSGFTTEELMVDAASPFLGRTPAQIMETNPDVVVLGVRGENNLRRWHEVDGPMKAGDVLIVVSGDHAHLNLG